MVVIGLWLAVVGYAVLYAGVSKLGGTPCTMGQALRGSCTPGAQTTAATAGAGTTLLDSQQRLLSQQQGAVPTTPVMGA